MKKKLAAMLCGVLCVGAFTGCSNTELAYLKMSKDLLDTMQTCKVEGTMQADVNFDEMQSFLADAAETAGIPSMESGLEQFSGKKSVTVDYDMQIDLQTMEYDMSFDVDYAGQTYDLGTLYYSLTDGVYVTTDTLWGVYQLAGACADKADTFVFSDAFARDFKHVLAEDEYVELLSAEDLTGVNMEGVLPKDGIGDLYDAVFTFYEDVLKGFETGLVKQENGTFVIQADGQDVAQLLIDLLDFVAANPEQVLDATETYLMAVLDSTNSGAEEKAQMQEVFAEWKASQQDFVDAAGDISLLLQQLVQDPSVAMLLDSFQYDATVKKTGDGFVSKELYTMKHNGKNAVKLTTESTTTKAATEVSIPQGGMTLAELSEELERLENKYNPVVGVVIDWGWDDENTMAGMQTLRQDAAAFGGSYMLTDLIVQDGRAYLPLRTICDSLGETVGWDNAAKTPYVMQNGKRVDMKGILQDGSAFVGVRDFSKLGYAVDYHAEDGLKTVEITK